MLIPQPDRARALRWCEVLAAYTEVVASAEYLATERDRRPGGVEDWDVAAGLSPLRSERVRRLVAWIAAPGRTRTLHAVRAAAAATVLAARGPTARLLAGAVACGCSTVLHPRHRRGSDGADHAAFAVHAAVTMVRAAGATPAATDAGLWFVAATGGLAYTASGWAKAGSEPWRDGRAVPGVVRTRTYGEPSLGRLIERHAGLGRALGAAVLALECAFPLAWADRRGRSAPLVLATALGFHLVNARVMGLNRFVPAFAATYPAILYTAAPSRGRDDTFPRVAAVLAVAALGAAAAREGAR